MADQSSKSESSPARRPALAVTMREMPLVRQRPSTARAVGSFVPALTRKAVEKFGFSTAALITDWTAIVGAELARHTRPQKLRWPKGVDGYAETAGDAAGRPGATLHLQVDAAKALDVQYKGRQIIDRINAYFGYRAIAEMRIEQMPLAAVGRQVMPRDTVPSPRARDPKASVDLGHISDDRLRAALERVQRGLSRR